MPSVQVDDKVQISYRVMGEGPVDVLFVHCWGNSSYALDGLLEVFDTRGLRALVPDLRGGGQSDQPATGYTLERFARDMMAVADHAGARRFIVVGHSMGGQIAMLMSATWPDRVMGQALVAPVPPSGSSMDQATTDLCRNSAGNRESKTTIYNFGSPQMKPEIRERLIDDGVKVAKAAIQEGFDAWTKADIVSRLAATRAPTLVIATDDPFYAVEHQREKTAGVIPGARLAYVPACGHWIPSERPRELAAVLQAFIAGVR